MTEVTWEGENTKKQTKKTPKTKNNLTWRPGI